MINVLNVRINFTFKKENVLMLQQLVIAKPMIQKLKKLFV